MFKCGEASGVCSISGSEDKISRWTVALEEEEEEGRG
jgi:hypothetical protein